MLALGVHGDLVHRARAVERVEGDQVVELVRADLLQRLPHPLGLELEHARGVTPGEHLVGGRVIERQRGHVRALAAGALDDVQRVLDHVEVAQPEEVHLEDADLADRVHRELGHGAELALPALVHPRVGELQRHDVGQRAVGDHHRGGVDRGVAHDPLEALGDLHDLPRLRLLVTRLAQRLAALQAFLERRRAAHDRVRDQLRQAVADAVVEAQHAGRVAGGLAGEHLAEGHDLGDRLAPVLVRHVAHHALAPADREVDVDVRHRHPLGVQEALEQEVVAERVHVGDRQAVGHDRPRRRAAAGADGDAVLLGELDEVPHDQEVGVEAHAVDHVELDVHPFQRLGRRRVAVAEPQTLGHPFAQVLPLAAPVGRLEPRDQLLAQLQLDLAAFGDLDRAGDRLRPLREGRHHLGGVPQVELVRFEAQLRGLDRALRLHAQQGRVVVVVLSPQVVDVAGPHQAPAHLAGDLDDPLVALVLGGEAVLLHLEVHVLLAEHPHQLPRVGAGVVHAVLEQPLAEARGQASGERDHALAVALELAEVDGRLAPLQAFQEARRGELDEVAVALVRGGQQRQVVALHPRLGGGPRGRPRSRSHSRRSASGSASCRPCRGPRRRS